MTPSSSDSEPPPSPSSIRWTFARACRCLTWAAGWAAPPVTSPTTFGITFYRELRARIADSGPLALGLNIVMGQDAANKVANMIGNLDRASIAPTEMICQPAEYHADQQQHMP